MTMKTILTVVLLTIAVFVFKSVSAKTAIDIMLAVFIIAMFQMLKENKT